MMENMADPEFAAANCLVLNPKMIRDTALGNSTSESGTGQIANMAGLLPGDCGNEWRSSVGYFGGVDRLVPIAHVLF